MNIEVVRRFQKLYKEKHPNEIQPLDDYIDFLELSSDIILITQYNILFIKESKTRYEVFGHWCMAHKDFSFIDNYKAFREVLDIVRKLDKPCVISELNEAYHKVTEYVDKDFRKF